MKLAGDFILVLPNPSEDKTQSGIWLPDQAKKKENRGTIVLVGTGLPDEPMDAKIGEYILHNSGVGLPIDYNGQEHLLMRQSDKIAELGSHV